MFNLNEQEKQYDFDFEMALLDIKSGRYIDAESRLSNVAREIKSSNAYLGIGITKLGRFIDDETNKDEIFYCFQRAIELSEKPEDAYLIICEIILKTIKQYAEIVIVKANELNEAISNEAIAKLGLAGSIMVSPLMKDKKNAKLANTIIGVGSFFNISVQKNKQQSAGIEGAKLAIKIDILKNTTEKFLEKYTDIKNAFTAAYTEIEDYTYQIAATKEQKQKRAEKERVEKLDKVKKQLPDSSPYYLHLQRALEYQNSKDYEFAIASANEGLKLIPGDDELENIRKGCITGIAERKASPYTITGLVLSFVTMSIIMLNVAGNSEVKKTDNAFATVVFVSLIPFVILYFLGRQKAKSVKQQYEPL